GIYDRFKQVALGAHTADPREVRPDLASKITNRVARDARRAGAVEDGLTASMIAAEKRGLEFLKACFLLRQINIEQTHELLTFLLDGFGEFRQASLEHVRPQPLEAFGLL